MSFWLAFFHLQAASACLALGRVGTGEAVSHGWVGAGLLEQNWAV